MDLGNSIQLHMVHILFYLRNHGIQVGTEYNFRLQVLSSTLQGITVDPVLDQNMTSQLDMANKLLIQLNCSFQSHKSGISYLLQYRNNL